MTSEATETEVSAWWAALRRAALDGARRRECSNALVLHVSLPGIYLNDEICSRTQVLQHGSVTAKSEKSTDKEDYPNA